MLIIDCKENNNPGYKYGEEGTCYIYNPNDQVSKQNAYDKAKAQGKIIEISKIRKSSLKKTSVKNDLDLYTDFEDSWIWWLI